MANCPNCGAKLSCGCQRRTASDGKQGCAQCIPMYEEKLKSQNSKIKIQRPGQEQRGLGRASFR